MRRRGRSVLLVICSVPFLVLTMDMAARERGEEVPDEQLERTTHSLLKTTHPVTVTKYVYIQTQPFLPPEPKAHT